MKVVWPVVAAVLLVGVMVHFFWWILGAAAAYGLYRGGRRLWREHRDRVAWAAHRRAQLLACAELQHRWYLDGDLRGTYGRYPPAA